MSKGRLLDKKFMQEAVREMFHQPPLVPPVEATPEVHHPKSSDEWKKYVHKLREKL